MATGRAQGGVGRGVEFIITLVDKSMSAVLNQLLWAVHDIDNVRHNQVLQITSHLPINVKYSKMCC